MILIAGWQIGVSIGWLQELYVSRPSAIASAAVRDMQSGVLLSAVGTTLFETVVGFGIAVIFGILAGLILHQIPLANAVLRGFLTAFNNMPRLALSPLFVLWFGLGSLSKIALVVSLCFFLVTYNTYAGLQSANRDHLLLAKTLGAGRVSRFLKFLLPSSVPSIFAGCQLALTYAFLAAVVGEMLAGSEGLGAFLQLTLASYRIDSFFGGLVVLVVIATVLSALMRTLEVWLLRWRRVEMRGIE